MKDATVAAERALLLRPADLAIRTNLGHTLTRAGRVEEALGIFDDQLAADPQWVYGYAFAAFALAEAGYPDEAARVAEAGIEREPFLLLAHIALIQTEMVRGRYAAARKRLMRLLDVHPDFVANVVDLGLAEELAGDTAEARRHYERAQTMSPNYSVAALRLAQLHWRDHDRAGAERLLRQVEAESRSRIDWGVDEPMPRWQLAAAASVRGDRDTALQWYTRAIDAGRGDVMWDEKDPLFSAIHRTPEFLRLRHRVQAEHRSIAPLAARLVSRMPVSPLARR